MYCSPSRPPLMFDPTRAKCELPSLRRDLCVKTQKVNRVISTQCRSFEGAGRAKAERDMRKDFVELQVLSILFLKGDHSNQDRTG